MGLFSGKKSALFGLDMSPAAIRLLALSQHKKGYRVEAYAVESMPAGLMEENSITDIEALGETLKRIIKRAGVRNKHAAIALARSAVISKTISLPDDLSGRDLEDQVMFEADRDIPFPLDEVNLDFNVKGPSVDAPEKVDVLWVASRSEQIDDRVAVLEEAGVTCELVDVESYAIESACNLLAQDWPSIGGRLVAVIDINEQLSTLNVLANQELIETREQYFGYALLLGGIQKQYGMSEEAARKGLQDNNLPQNYASVVLAPFLESLVYQVQSAVQDYASDSKQQIGLVVLAGGGATLPGIVEAVQQQVDVPVRRADPFANMVLSKKVHATSLRRHAPSLLVACGLALRSFG